MYLLSKKTGMSVEAIHLLLQQLHKDEIVGYQAQHNDLEITFLVPREDDLTINAFSRNVQDYVATKTSNVASILAYIKNRKLCRNRQLLLYFGEKTENCYYLWHFILRGLQSCCLFGKILSSNRNLL